MEANHSRHSHSGHSETRWSQSQMKTVRSNTAAASWYSLLLLITQRIEIRFVAMSMLQCCGHSSDHWDHWAALIPFWFWLIPIKLSNLAIAKANFLSLAQVVPGSESNDCDLLLTWLYCVPKWQESGPAKPRSCAYQKFQCDCTVQYAVWEYDSIWWLYWSQEGNLEVKLPTLQTIWTI